MQNMSVYFQDFGSHIELISSLQQARHGKFATPVIVRPNKVFYDSMKINYSPRYGKHLYLTSMSDGSKYPIFRTEFKYIIDNCKIDKSVTEFVNWTIRNHGGLFSIRIDR